MGNEPHARTRLAGEEPVFRLAAVQLTDFLTPYRLERIAISVQIAARRFLLFFLSPLHREAKAVRQRQVDAVDDVNKSLFHIIIFHRDSRDRYDAAARVLFAQDRNA